MTEPPKWTIATDDDLSLCAKQLWDDHHIATDDHRGWDVHGDYHRLDVHCPDPDNSSMVTIEVGCQLRLIDGVPKAMSAAELAAWGVS